MTDILVVDDEQPIRRLLGRVLSKNGYSFAEAGDAETARKLLSNKPFELILCDVRMPGETGIEFIRDVAVAYPDTAVMMVTAVDDPEVAETVLDIGAYGYITKPFKPNEVLINIRNALRRRELEITHRNYREELEREVAERTAGLQKAMEGIIQAISLAVEIRDPYTAGHQQRATDLACRIAREMGVEESRIEGIRMAGRIHDLGKISVAAEILNKPGQLSEAEFSLIKDHARIGFEILKGIEFPWPVAQIVLQHHERMDGSGYPKGLRGEDILLEAKILSVADVVEAIASHRPYRPALGVQKALREITEHSGTRYEPDAVEACLRLFREKGFQLTASQSIIS